MTTILNLAEWLRTLRTGQIKCAKLHPSKEHSIRCTAYNINRVYGMDRGNHIHIHYDWNNQVVIAVCISTAERELELSSIEHKDDWKKKIPNCYDGLLEAAHE